MASPLRSLNSRTSIQSEVDDTPLLSDRFLVEKSQPHYYRTPRSNDKTGVNYLPIFYASDDSSSNTDYEDISESNSVESDNNSQMNSSPSIGYSPHPYKMVKKALSLFAHWKPSLYNTNEDNSNSDLISAVSRAHSRPIGGPLRWGRRRR